MIGLQSVVVTADATSRALSGLASALKVPVHVVAILLLALLAFELGRIAAEGWRRVRPGTLTVEQLAAGAMAEPGSAAQIARRAPGPLTERAIVELAARTDEGADAIERVLADYELGIQRRLDRTRILVRAGPALGLMGTLIPLAPGLGALGRGDFGQLAGDLEVAFAATVVGILVGTAAFALTLIRTRVYTEDLAGLERAVAARGAIHVRLAASVGEEAT